MPVLLFSIRYCQKKSEIILMYESKKIKDDQRIWIIKCFFFISSFKVK